MGVTALAELTSGGLLGCSPGGALAATSRMRERRSGTMIPLTGPPAQFTLDADPASDGSFTVAEAGYYTLILTTQSRQTIRVLLYVEN